MYKKADFKKSKTEKEPIRQRVRTPGGSCYVLLGLCVTPKRTVINGGLSAVAVVSVGFTMCTDGVTVGCIPNTLPLRPSSGPAVEPRSPSVTPTLDALLRRRSTTAFCFCLTNSIARTCSIADGSSRCIVKPITTGEIGVEEPVCTSRLCICVGVRKNESSAEGKLFMLRATPLIVTRLRLDGGLGLDCESDGESVATLVTSTCSGKGTPTGVG